MTCRVTLMLVAAMLAVNASNIIGQQRVERRHLTTTVVIDGITCGPTGRAFAELYPSGKLRECPLAADTVLFGHVLPAATWVIFTEDGSPWGAWLSRDTRLSGHPCHGTGYKGFSVRFYPTGVLEGCFLAADTEIEGVPCIRGTFWTEVRGGGKSMASFREDASLARCQAARSFELDGVRFAKWQVIVRDSAGRLPDHGPRPSHPYGKP